ncbi:MAG: HK97 family phage prohead protease [Bryobacteraceae bacterium]|jgi:hypothetical protein
MKSIEERRALLARMGGEVRTLSADVVRSLAKETQDSLQVIRQTQAACYALMSYLCYMPYDSFPDGVYAALYECWTCCGLCVDLIGRESNLSPAGQALCAAACSECVSVCTGTADVILQACVSLCGDAVKACGSGSGDEGRAARNAGDETRACKIEFRKAEDGHIKGYPILFNALSEDLGGFRERILPDAIQFADDLKADFNHNPDYILGRTLAGTLKVSTDARGAFMDADPPDTTWARDLKVSIDRGDIDQGSFSFRVLPGGQQISEENGQQVRTLSKILVRRVSVVSDPAYTKTSIEVRSKQGDQIAAGQAAPPAPIQSGGVGLDLLRRKLELV